MTSTPKVSVLIPTYNYENLLPEAIESVLNQTFADFELIIIDNASLDNTEEVVKRYLKDPRVKFFVNPKRGVVSNWNRSLELASGEYIKMLCADDKIHCTMLEKYVEVLDQNPSISIVSCQKELFGEHFRPVPMKLPVHGYLTGKDAVIAQTRYDNFLGEPSLPMFRKRDLHVGPFRDYQWIVDWEMYIRILMTGDCYVIPEILCYARRHSGQVTSKIRKSRIRQLEEYQLFKALYKGQYMNFSDSERKELAKQVRRKVTACVTEMYKLLPQITNAESRKTFRKLFHVASNENAVIDSSAIAMLLKFQVKKLKKLLSSTSNKKVEEKDLVYQ